MVEWIFSAEAWLALATLTALEIVPKVLCIQEQTRTEE